MTDYRPAHWAAAYFNDPIERCQHADRNYAPHNRFSPYVDPNFHQPSYHRADMPHHHHNHNHNHNCTATNSYPRSMSGYMSYTVPMWQ